MIYFTFSHNLSISSQSYFLLTEQQCFHVERTFANAYFCSGHMISAALGRQSFINSPSVKGFDACAIFSLMQLHFTAASLILFVFDDKCCRKFSLFF